MSSIPAASSSETPAKKRSLTSRALTGSSASSCRRASSSASRSSPGALPEPRGTVRRPAARVERASGLGALLVTGLIDQDAAHRLGRGREEMPAAIPLLVLFTPRHPEIRLVHQGRGLERLAGPLLRQLLGGQLRSSS